MQEITETRDKMRWLVSSAVRALLVGPDGLRLHEWLRNRQARIVKHGPHRIVYRVDLPSLSFYIKHNLVPDTRARLRQMIRPSKARMEFDRALSVAALGVATYTPLAVGEQSGRSPGESFLITRTLDQTTPLNLFFENDFLRFAPFQQSNLRKQIAARLGQLVSRLHDKGILHDDLHCGNFLIRLDADGKPELFLVDLQAVRFRGPLGWRTRRRNLAMLNRWFYNRSSRADRLRFWKNYLGTTAMSTEHAERSRQVEEESDRSNDLFWRRRERRCLEDNKYFWTIRKSGLTGYATRQLPPKAIASLLADPDSPFVSPGKVLKDSPSTTVVELELLIDGQRRSVIYKRFRASWSDPLANAARMSPALRSWLNGHRLLDRGLPTARPLAVFHRRRYGLLTDGYLLTEKVPDAVQLGTHVQAHSEHGALIRRHIDHLARLVREMHRRHLAHRDLKAGNILVNSAATAEASPFVLIDLVGVTRHSKVDLRHRVQNLARLNASFVSTAGLSRTDRLRFLRIYLQWGYFGRHTWKKWWRQIEAETLSKIERNIRRGRPLA